MKLTPSTELSTDCPSSRRRFLATAIGACAIAPAGVVVVNNLDIQTEDALHRTQRTSVNLTRTPVPPADIVFEFLAGTRTNRNGDHGASSQFQAGWTMRF